MRSKLVGVGRRLFARRGYAGVAAEEIVAAAGVTRGALYHHFDGKEGLFRAVLVEEMAALKARLARAAAAGSPAGSVERGIRAYLRACAEPRVRRVLLVDGPAVLGWHAWRALDLQSGLGLLRRGLQAAGVADAEVATQVLAGALIDGAMLIGQRPRDAKLRRRVERALLRLLRGLKAGR
jgi:AcrR family transcriptional regulator